MLRAKMFSVRTLGFLGQGSQRIPEVGAGFAPPFVTEDVVKKSGIDLFVVILGMKTFGHIPFKVSPTHIHSLFAPHRERQSFSAE